MFKVSQVIRLNINGNDVGGSGGPGGVLQNEMACNAVDNHNGKSIDLESDGVFGKYQRSPDMDAYPTENPHVFIAPELTDPSKVQLLHFPNGIVRINSEVRFILKRNGVRGNFEVKLENPAGVHCEVPLISLDPERFEVVFTLMYAGLYKVHIKCNSVPLNKSPFIIASIYGGHASIKQSKTELLSFKSDATKVLSRGLGLSHIYPCERNEFTVDGSAAGNNILYVGILGPQGQCEEVVIRHLGHHIYNVTYQVEDIGDYILAVKWGDDHIPGSPFYLNAN